ncbi:MAG: peptidylprolyl isomerase [Candidatus Omnitrophota bacterium]
MRKMIKDILSLAVFLCVLLASATAFSGVVDKVIVVVNDEVITQREFDRAFGSVKQTYEANFKGEELEKRLEGARKQLLEQIVNSKLIVSLARAEKIEVDEEELGGRLERVKSFYSSEDEFLRALSAKGTNLTEFEKELKEQMLGQKLVEKEVANKIVITPAEIRDVYGKNKEQLVIPKRVKLRGIMVRKATDEAGNKEAQEKIDKIVSDLKKGRVFESLARDRSEGPYAATGGDMGYVSPGQMIPEIDGVVFALKEGQISDVVESNIGYHVFLVDQIEESREAGFDEVSDFIKGEIYKRKFEENLVKWIEEKRENAYISYK